MNIIRDLFRALPRGPILRIQPISTASFRARSRFRHSMPGELGLSAAARLYGVGR